MSTAALLRMAEVSADSPGHCYPSAHSTRGGAPGHAHPSTHSTRGEDPGHSFDAVELRTMFHRLSNQLGIVLAHAELLEAKAPDPAQRARASQVVQAAVDATRLARGIRERVDDPQ